MQPEVKSLFEQDLVSRDKAIARELASKANLRELQANEKLYAEGDEANFIFLILEGTCKPDGTRIRAVIKRGTFLGELPLLGVPALRADAKPAYAVTAVAHEKCILAQVSYADFEDVAAKHPQVWKFMAATLARRLNERFSPPPTK